MIREAELHARASIIPGGWLAALGPFIWLAACAAYLWIHGAETRARFTSQRGGDEQPNGLAVRGVVSTYFLSIGGILAALTLILYGLAHWVRPVYAGGPEGAVNGMKLLIGLCSTARRMASIAAQRIFEAK